MELLNFLAALQNSGDFFSWTWKSAAKIELDDISSPTKYTDHYLVNTFLQCRVKRYSLVFHVVIWIRHYLLNLMNLLLVAPRACSKASRSILLPSHVDGCDCLCMGYIFLWCLRRPERPVCCQFLLNLVEETKVWTAFNSLSSGLAGYRLW